MQSLYQNIMQTLQSRIASGEISGRLPSIAALEAEFGVSHATIKKVIDQLKLLGIVYGKQGKGVFVSDKHFAKNGTVAVYLPLVIFGTPFYMRFGSALQSIFTQKGYDVFSCSTIADVTAANADWAVIIGDPQLMDANCMLTHVYKQRIILINQPDGELFAVNNDNYLTGYHAIEYLYTHGHRKIGVLSRELNIANGIFTDRMEGAMAFAGQHPDITLVNQSLWGDEKNNPTEILATRAAVALLEKAPDLTAIFAFTDVLAIGVMSEIQRRKLRIPEDISLISVDNRSFAGLCNPPLTTFQEGAEEMAEVVAEKIMANFREGLPCDGRIRIPAKLIERNSVRKIQQQPFQI